MTDATTPDPLKPEERQLVDELSQRAHRSSGDLLRRAKNNELGINERVLAELDWDALDSLYTILAQAMDELMAEIVERQHAGAAALRNRLDELSASTLMTGIEEEHDKKDWNEACGHTLQAMALIGDMFEALNPPKVRKKPSMSR